MTPQRRQDDATIDERKGDIKGTMAETVDKDNSKLPSGWRWVKLGEVCDSNENRDPRNTPNIPFQYVDISGIDNHIKRIIDARTILGKDAPSRARQVIKTNDVLVSTTRPNLNAVALVPKKLHDEICSTGFCVLRPTEFIDSLFLFAFVQTQYFIETISNQVRGMLYPAVTDNQVRNVYFPLPSLSEQKRIATKLQELMQEIEHARTSCKKQLEAAKALSSAYLRQVFESDEAKKWERKKLGEVCNIQTGKKDVNEGAEGGKYLFFTCAAEPLRSNTYSFEGESLLLVGNGANVGLVLFYDGKFEAYQRTYVLNNFSCIVKYAYYFLKLFWKKFNEDKQFGSATNYIRLGNINNFSILLPPLTLQCSIVIELEEKMAQVEKLQSTILNQKSALDVLPQAILRKAFRGEL